MHSKNDPLEPAVCPTIEVDLSEDAEVHAGPRAGDYRYLRMNIGEDGVNHPVYIKDDNAKNYFIHWRKAWMVRTMLFNQPKGRVNYYFQK